jgi:beta-lactamase class C
LDKQRESKHTQAVPHTKDRRSGLPGVTIAALLAMSPLAGADAPSLPAPLAATSQPLLAPRDQGVLAKQIEVLAQRVVSEAKVSGLAVAMVQDDAILLERGFGLVDSGSKEAVTVDTVFRLASLSKAFAGTLSAMLVQDGALRWDTRVSDHLPAFKLRNLQAAQTLTVKDILSHRAGLPHNTYDRQLEADEPYPLLVAKLDGVAPICDAGQCYSYQNIAFSLVGDLVFAATGDFYSHQVEKRLFHPLGMYNATYGPRRARSQRQLGAPACAARRTLGGGAAEGELLPHPACRRRQRQHPRPRLVDAGAARPASRRDCTRGAGQRPGGTGRHPRRDAGLPLAARTPQ